MSDAVDSAVVTPSGGTSIIITRELKASRERVWEAFHDPSLVSQWWGPVGRTNHITEIDLRPGGRWRFGQKAPDGSEVIYGGEYVEIDAPRKFVYTKHWANMPDDEQASNTNKDSVITAIFEEEGGTTTVTLECEFASSFIRDQALESGMERMQRSYDRMDTLLASG
ncbi:MAG: glutathione S-transferase [Hyphomicrobiales bacterium]|nr:MAG: glutathione S-transferase [Hyphomicrobiales bacterium]